MSRRDDDREAIAGILLAGLSIIGIMLLLIVVTTPVNG